MPGQRNDVADLTLTPRVTPQLRSFPDRPRKLQGGGDDDDGNDDDGGNDNRDAARARIGLAVLRAMVRHPTSMPFFDALSRILTDPHTPAVTMKSTTACVW